MSILTAIGVWLAAWVTVALLGWSATGARVGFVLVVALLSLPWFVSAPYQLVVMLAFALGFLFTSEADFSAGRRPPTFAGRLLYVIAFVALVDPFTATRIQRVFDRQAARRILVAVGCGSLAVAMWMTTDAWPAASRIPLRIVAAAALILAVAELTSDLVRVLGGICGFHFAPVHDHPYRSLTVTEFWSRRWNLMGGRWFRERVFVPLRSRGMNRALFAMFGVNAAMHVYLIAAVVPLKWMVWCALFFLAQPFLLMMERRLRVRRWPSAVARVWTAATLTSLLPLVLAALLTALGIGW